MDSTAQHAAKAVGKRSSFPFGPVGAPGASECGQHFGILLMKLAMLRMGCGETITARPMADLRLDRLCCACSGVPSGRAEGGRGVVPEATLPVWDIGAGPLVTALGGAPLLQ